MNELIPQNPNLGTAKRKRGRPKLDPSLKKNRGLPDTVSEPNESRIAQFSDKILSASKVNYKTEVDILNNSNDFIFEFRKNIKENSQFSSFYSMEYERNYVLKLYDLLISNGLLKYDFVLGWIKYYAKYHANGLRAKNPEKTSVKSLIETFTKFRDKNGQLRNTKK